MAKGLGARLQAAAQRVLQGDLPLDPTRYDDPVAEQTDWTPIGGSSANFRTHRLREVEQGRLEFRTTLGAKLFWMIFAAIGLGLLAVFYGNGLQAEGFEWNPDMLGVTAFGLVFAAVGFGGLYFSSAPIVFDLRRGLFWKGRKAPGRVADRRRLKHFAELNDVHALQLLRTWSTGKNRRRVYELNLVLKDGERVPVLRHGGSLAALRAEAEQVARLLDRPLWDATR
ncbi:hypothetical protein TVNIR_3757 [Thioalkalivibrio nitratireducens DSM 14787]|uniref:Uncharacterized protein n=1 Tax=Thioalkalivibrio nitratireducens (strain DSM 14787 / UNIQEM 213 / ALEN2) TaxID=1255043 RepID=L0E2G4_THIND|nr:hypothetical protein [Thioalkalivibrio nitratireducens]AGA35385.1 hypothetical protein TVNIR_3757 [Thioalkalivibrio nitratireducens DSM 14787]